MWVGLRPLLELVSEMGLGNFFIRQGKVGKFQKPTLWQPC